MGDEDLPIPLEHSMKLLHEVILEKTVPRMPPFRPRVGEKDKYPVKLSVTKLLREDRPGVAQKEPDVRQRALLQTTHQLVKTLMLVFDADDGRERILHRQVKKKVASSRTYFQKFFLHRFDTLGNSATAVKPWGSLGGYQTIH